MSFWRDESGQGMLEYVLIIALIATAGLTALYLVMRRIKNQENTISNLMNQI